MENFQTNLNFILAPKWDYFIEYNLLKPGFEEKIILALKFCFLFKEAPVQVLALFKHVEGTFTHKIMNYCIEKAFHECYLRENCLHFSACKRHQRST